MRRNTTSIAVARLAHSCCGSL